MRDYGVVRVRFWEWAKCRRLDAEECELALYLLTSPHGNSLGCFRLPVAYLCDDLATDAATAARTLARLCELGFLARDEATGWTWITGYLRHNPIPNRNVGKAVEKQLDQVPAEVSFYAALIESLRSLADDKGLSGAFLDKLAQRYRNRSDTVSRRSRTQTQTQTQTQTHDHDQTQDHDPSEAEASDAGASRKRIFDAGVKLLARAGLRENRARGMIGKWCRDHTDQAVLEAIRLAERKSVAEPVSFITACLRPRDAPDDDAPRTVEEIIAMGEREGWWDGCTDGRYSRFDDLEAGDADQDQGE